ncbi:MAG: pyridoxamine 5'-phosphate oxidase family protein [Chitinophagales bacterium]
MDKLITDFIEKQRCASVCCLDEDKNPYCFNIFYVFDKVERRLYFKSSPSSNHAGYLHLNKQIAGTIIPDKLNMLAIRGIQFTGSVVEDPHLSHHHASAEYYKKFPYAFAMPGKIWIIQLDCVKMTDNTVSFGKKISWYREDLYEDIC